MIALDDLDPKPKRATLTVKSRLLASGAVSWFMWIRRPRPERDELIPLKQFSKLSDRPAVEAIAATYRKALKKGLAEPREAPPSEALAVLSFIEAPECGGVYFALQGDRVKIGTAKNIRARLHGATTFAAYDVSLLAWMPGSRSTEMALHARFRELRVRGEWFHFKGELREFVVALRQQRPSVDAASADLRARGVL